TQPPKSYYGNSTSYYRNSSNNSDILVYKPNNNETMGSPLFSKTMNTENSNNISKVNFKKKPIPVNSLLKCNKIKSNYRIMLDPGHGGKDPGGSGNGIREKDIVLTISRKLKTLLQSNGFKVYTTRSTDVYLSLSQRVAMSRKVNASLMLSIHANTIPNKPHIRGTLTIYPKSSTSSRNTWLSKVLAESVEGCFKANKIFASRGTVRDYRGLYILRKASVPTALTEIGFMTNKQDAALMKQAEHQKRIVTELYNGIVTYLNRLN
ncbi:MAG: N-acetylmuramoyl-L-alanine amidase, partial [Planctomycetes bacterium]|nr:N-acetylmuramoyl-L-alanine amidase [Planctomycetota bacterium]